MKKHFNKNLIISIEEKEKFEKTNICWIFGKVIDFDQKVRDYCHITGNCRGASHWNCNINLKISKNVPLIFHNLEAYDSHLIFKELTKLNVKVSMIPNDLEEYMSFSLNKYLIFIDSMLFINFILEKLV